MASCWIGAPIPTTDKGWVSTVEVGISNVPVPMPLTETVAVKLFASKSKPGNPTIWLVSAVDVMMNEASVNALPPRLPLPTLENVYVTGAACAFALMKRTANATVSRLARLVMCFTTDAFILILLYRLLPLVFGI